MERIGHIFTTIIGTGNFNMGVVLSLDQVEKVAEVSGNFRFLFQKIYPCHPREIIDEDDKISIALWSRDWGWTQHVRMNK